MIFSIGRFDGSSKKWEERGKNAPTNVKVNTFKMYPFQWQKKCDVMVKSHQTRGKERKRKRKEFRMAKTLQTYHHTNTKQNNRQRHTPAPCNKKNENMWNGRRYRNHCEWRIREPKKTSSFCFNTRLNQTVPTAVKTKTVFVQKSLEKATFIYNLQ